MLDLASLDVFNVFFLIPNLRMAAEGPKPEMSAPIPGQMSTEQMRKVMSMTYKYRGVNFQPMLVPVENLKAMETFQVRDDDIFVLTYPKCGKITNL